ncbi:MAG: 2Fe-2S iron-sulfur cluster-binding protein [Actinomycetia bacterium]|nr:2Fe-2S iron-sulfur cluster-binding protein [Actinomycetes bacterium]
MGEKLIISIDGKACACEKGEYLLQVARRNGIFIPSLCNHEGLEGLGACRLCIVEVTRGGRTQTVVSCIYPVEAEIEVQTQTNSIVEQRSVIVALLARLAPQSQTIAQMAKFMGADLPRLAERPGGDKCILCGLCVVACEQVGTGAIAKVNRGVEKEIATPYHRPSAECIGCTACANVCPTGQIEYQQDEQGVTIWGRYFDYVACAACGKQFATAAAWEFSALSSASEAASVGVGADAGADAGAGAGAGAGAIGQGRTGVVADADALPAPPLCPECQRQQVAEWLASSSGRYGNVRVAMKELAGE